MHVFFFTKNGHACGYHTKKQRAPGQSWDERKGVGIQVQCTPPDPVLYVLQHAAGAFATKVALIHRGQHANDFCEISHQRFPLLQSAERLNNKLVNMYAGRMFSAFLQINKLRHANRRTVPINLEIIHFSPAKD